MDTKGRTYSKERWELAQRRWKDWAADASKQMREEWREWRHFAAMNAGIIDPPEGGRYDSWTDDSPSQLAILTRAIREDPESLKRAILSPGVHAWAAVIAVMVRGWDERMDEAELREERDRLEKERMTPTINEADQALRAVGWRVKEWPL